MPDFSRCHVEGIRGLSQPVSSRATGSWPNMIPRLEYYGSGKCRPSNMCMSGLPGSGSGAAPKENCGKESRVR